MIRLESPAAQYPPISVIPTNTTAVVSIPVENEKYCGKRADRIAPPATYCNEIITISIIICPITATI